MRSNVSECEADLAEISTCETGPKSAMDSAITPAPLGHPECGSYPPAEPEIKLATNYGGRRTGAGRKRKAPIAILPPRPFPPDARWYCAEVVGGRDTIAGEQLRQLGFAVHIPMLVAVDQPRHFVCGLCNPPARAGKGKAAGALSLTH